LPPHPVLIVSADSRQIYRHFDIGTAKPSAADRHLVPHAGIDIADPADRFNAARWAQVAEDAIRDAVARGLTPLIVGGTGLYLRALFEPLFHEPPLDAAARLALEAELAPRSTAELQRWVAQLDPLRAHLGRTQLLRAIEVALLTGTPISTWHREAQRPARYTARYLIADAGEQLATQLAVRVDAMLHTGWIDEVRRLAETVPAEAPAWKATGYATARRIAAGALGTAAGREEILISTRQYAKRQRTWMRHQLPTDWTARVDTRLMTQAIDEALGWWTEENNT
jgi:tRNA dimethylallyltransferase